MQKLMIVEREKYSRKIIELENNINKTIYKKDSHIEELKNMVKLYKAKYEKYKNLSSLNENTTMNKF